MAYPETGHRKHGRVACPLELRHLRYCEAYCLNMGIYVHSGGCALYSAGLTKGVLQGDLSGNRKLIRIDKAADCYSSLRANTMG